ncbi:hypothetical protein [Streptomyces sp. JJ36]|uniref:hypothetical protein n=1 Tax=Streptomyces sp. JJ36 TaxID=2736645 RepID=UPI001F1A3CF5|nr:hypothetical protein [Streptomyces sp. JJ36]MCF6522288.1 hypothetical protein [Streptomyces sp. JJ36]
MAAVTVLCCVGFALVNLDLLTTGFFAGEDYDRLTADHPVGFAVMNLLVLVLKLAGAFVAALTVAPRVRTSAPGRLLAPPVVGVSAHAAWITLGVYCAGSIAQGIVMIVEGDGIALGELAYVGFFALFALCYGVLGLSYHRRAGLRPRHLVLGTLGAIVLGGVLTAAIVTLTALGLVPSST